VNGAVTTAAQFTGSTSQALYIADTGAADPFRISTGSWGCWFRTAKRGTAQRVLAKLSSAAGQYAYEASITTANVVLAGASTTGSDEFLATGVSDVADDRWHFIVATSDATTLRLYVDGVLEATTTAGPIFGGSAPLNVGAFAADSGTAAASPHYGRVDEAFITADVLTEDQVRTLYAARLVHMLGAQPKTVSLSVRRQRRGAPLATTDFSTGPLRLYNMTSPGWATDQGSNNQTLTLQGGGVVGNPGPAGIVDNALSFAGTGSVAATDAGLPSALLARSYGGWFKTTSNVTGVISSWGTPPNGHVVTYVASGALNFGSGADLLAGPFVADGQWHFFVASEDNAAGDGVKRKLYVDGRLVLGSTVLNSTVLAGANRFRIGANPDGTSPFTGQIDGVFVTGYAMTTDEVLRLYAKASQTMPSSPKNSGDHVEGYDSGSVLVVADTLDAQHYIDLTLA
jgi:hypothetical protein